MSAPDQAQHAARLRRAGELRADLALRGETTSPQLEAWLRKDARNLEAWAASDRAWAALDAGSRDHTAQDVADLALARARAERAKAVIDRRRLALGAGLAASLALAVSLGLMMAPHTETYRTGDGERRAVILADGSRVGLDAGAELKVRLGPQRRDLELIAGQAAFAVAHDPTRPFAVTAGGRRVVATGTRFNIDLLPSGARITLVEGSVRVETIAPRGSSSDPVYLGPGQQLTTGGGAQAGSQVAFVDASKALAWEGGQLVFDNDLLPDALAQISRYGETKITVRDPALSQERISGVFVAGDLATFLDAIETHLDLQAVETAPHRLELRRRAG